MSTSTHTTCATGKVAYATKGQANNAAGLMSRYYGRKLWGYRCSRCSEWHLTSSPPRSRGEWKNRQNVRVSRQELA